MNKKIFGSAGPAVKVADTINEAGGKAYSFDAKHALAQYAITGCFNNTYYATGEDQMDKVLELLKQVDNNEYIAKLAVYARKKAFMKDMPAFLVAYLASKKSNVNDVLERSFVKVIDNSKMLRNFMQIIRSDKLGRKSFGTRVRRLIREWLDSKSDDSLFRDSVGNVPSIADIIKMVHPKPKISSRAELYKYLIGKPANIEVLPELVQQFERFKNDKSLEIPNVPFQFLTALNLGTKEWSTIAKQSGWQMVRMNLNTFTRHDCFKDQSVINAVVEKLKDKDQIKKARVFPYQLLMAYKATENSSLPFEIREALQDAMETAVDNVPSFDGKVVVCPDVSGSMSSIVTGDRGSASSKVRCIDVAALVSAVIMRRNPSSKVIPFEESVVRINLNSRDSIMTNADKLAKIGGGGTSCSAPLALLNQENVKADIIIYVSDNMSWADFKGKAYNYGTAMAIEWTNFKKRNPNAKLVLIDIQPNSSTQVSDDKSVLNVAGFSDQLFEVIKSFGEGNPEHFVEVIERTEL